jgi:hypothetical protein
MKATKKAYVLRDTMTGRFYRKGGATTTDLKRAFLFGTEKSAREIRLSAEEVIPVTIELSIEEE